MSQAGFYHLNLAKEPDLVRCCCCFKELEGWTPEDDPWNQHRDDTSKCLFAKMNKCEDDLTVDEFIQLLENRELNILVFIRLILI